LPITTIVDPGGNNVSVFEIGPAILLPDRRVLAIGATGQTALYMLPPPQIRIHRDPGVWTRGPSFPPDTSTHDGSWSTAARGPAFCWTVSWGP
jgi:hypothetical protein